MMRLHIALVIRTFYKHSPNDSFATLDVVLVVVVELMDRSLPSSGERGPSTPCRCVAIRGAGLDSSCCGEIDC
jgi:hypothetical protein